VNSQNPQNTISIIFSFQLNMLIFVQGQANIPLKFLKQDSNTGNYLFQYDIPANITTCIEDELWALNDEYVIFSKNTTVLTAPESWDNFWIKQ